MEQQLEFRVIFSFRRSTTDHHSENTIVIVPLERDWNDFGHQSRVEFCIVPRAGGDPYVSTTSLGFLDIPANALNGSRRLQQLLSESDDLPFVNANDYKFFTMLPDMDAYRRLIAGLGSDYGGRALKAMNDLVAAQHSRVNPILVEQATSTDIFQKSFVRSSESYFAFKNGGSVLDGEEFKQFNTMSRQICIEFHLPERRNAHSLRFKFDHDADLPKRISIVIGKNGVGKSQTLGRIARSALDDDRVLFDGEVGERVLLNRLLAFAPTNEAGSVFPRERRKSAKIYYRRFSLNRSQATRGRPGLADDILQIVRSSDRLGDFSRWNIFRSAVRSIANWEQISLSMTSGVSRYIQFDELTQGGEQRVLEKLGLVDLSQDPVRVVGGDGYPLSSGEISFIRFCAHASLHIENGSLLLIDEPETHLHPNFISQFVALLDTLLEKTGSSAIVATHSVYFVREVFREQVNVLRVDDDGYVIVETPNLNTFGADVGAVSYFVFGEDEPSRLVSRISHRLRSRFKDWRDIYQKYKDELSLEMLGALRDDPDRVTKGE